MFIFLIQRNFSYFCNKVWVQAVVDNLSSY